MSKVLQDITHKFIVHQDSGVLLDHISHEILKETHCHLFLISLYDNNKEFCPLVFRNNDRVIRDNIVINNGSELIYPKDIQHATLKDRCHEQVTINDKMYPINNYCHIKIHDEGNKNLIGLIFLGNKNEKYDKNTFNVIHDHIELCRLALKGFPHMLSTEKLHDIDESDVDEPKKSRSKSEKINVIKTEDKSGPGYIIPIREHTSEDEGSIVKAKSDITPCHNLNRSSSIQSRDLFFAKMSHEIRTPLNGILGMTQLMSSTPLNDSQTEYVKIIQQCGMQLTDIINDILDYSKLRAGKMELSIEDMNLKQCIESSIQVVSVRAEKKGLSLYFDIDNKLPQYIVCDKKRLKQILVNLLSNAVKFTDTGRVSVKVHLLSKKEDDYRIKFIVEDTGIGIKPDAKIFEEFEQVPDEERNPTGTGLGLSICKNIVSLMNGSITYDSVPGKGTDFIFEIDAKESELNIAENMEKIKGKTVLVVDDNAVNRMFFTKTLMKWGLLVQTASNSEEALMLLEMGNRYDIAFVDICMPKINGEELAQIINKKDYSIRLVAMSSKGLIDDDSLFLETLVKPVSESQIRSILISLFDNDDNRHDPYKSSEKTTKILLAEDNKTNQEVCKIMLKNIGYNNITIAENGVEVLELLSGRPNYYDLILMDIKMPIMDGFQATKQVKELYGKYPYIVAVTANVSREYKDKCTKLGMAGFIEKPIQIEKLKIMLELIDDRINVRKGH